MEIVKPGVAQIPAVYVVNSISVFDYYAAHAPKPGRDMEALDDSEFYYFARRAMKWADVMVKAREDFFKAQKGVTK